MKKQFVVQFLGGICGGTILGIFLFVTMMNYGGQNGCFPLIEKIFNGVGYEPCGDFGAKTGLFFGSLFGILIARKIKLTDLNYSKIVKWIISITVLVPLFYGIVFGQLRDSLSEIFIVFAVLALFLVLSAIYSVILTSIINWKMFKKQKIKL
jgi:hypothetical protein